MSEEKTNYNLSSDHLSIIDEFDNSMDAIYAIAELLMNSEGTTLAGRSAGIILKHAMEAKDKFNQIEEAFRVSQDPVNLVSNNVNASIHREH